MLEEVFTVILEPLGLLLSRTGKSGQLLESLRCRSPMNQGSAADSYEVGMLGEHVVVFLLQVWRWLMGSMRGHDPQGLWPGLLC